MTRIFRSTTALVAILGIVAPTFVQAEATVAAPAPIRLAQGDAPVVVVPPGEPQAEAEAPKKKVKAKEKAADEPVVVAPSEGKPKADAKKAAKEPASDAPAKAKAESKKAANEPVVVVPSDEAEPDRAKADRAEAQKAEAKKAAAQKAEAKKAAAQKAEAKKVEAEKADQPRVVTPDDSAPAKKAAARDNQDAAPKKAAAREPVVVAPDDAKPATVRKAADTADDAGKPVVVAPAAAKAVAEKKPVVVSPEQDAEATAKARPTDEPVVVAKPDSKKPVVVANPDAVRAATGQSEAPKVVTPDEAALAAALAAAQGAKKPARDDSKANADARTANSEQPVVVAPPGEDAAAKAAAKGGPVRAEALEAAVEPGRNTKAVVVTEGSSRSSSEDFGTSVAAAAAAAAAATKKGPVGTDARDGARDSDGQPVVVVPGEPREARNRDDDDDDDDTLGTLAAIAAAGLGVYAAGQILDNNRGQVALNTGDRVVVQAPDGSQQIWRDDDALLLRPGSEVATENFPDGSSRSVVTRADGSRVVTIRDAQLRVLRRTLISPDGTATDLINDAAEIAPVDVARLPAAAPAARINPSSGVSTQDLRAALEREASIDRRFSLGQIRDISQVRNLVAPISIDSITFDTGSAAIPPTQAQQLSTLGQTIAEMVRQNPREIFLVEGYTDTVGLPASNLALSDRRAESLALALNEYFGVPPENMVVQGYGENFLRVNADGDIRDNRRVAVRRITDLLQQ